MEKFVYTTALDKIRKLTKKIRVIKGGSSSSKTFSIIPILMDMCAREARLEVSIVGESIPFLRRGAMKDFKKIMQMTGRWVDVRWNGTLMKYTFANGSYIEFFSVDDEAKIRGARRNILFVNECNNINFEAYHAMAIRTSGTIFLDYNPSAEFWVDEHLLRTGREDVDRLRLTYKDNEPLSASIVAELEMGRELGFYDTTLGSDEDEYAPLFRDENIKNHYWANFWRVFGLGLNGTLDDQIFKGYQLVDGIPPMAKLVSYGLDFGYSNDPTAIVAVWKHGEGYYLEEKLYEKRLDYTELGNRMRDVGISVTDSVICDSADPRGIDTLRKMGFKGVRPCKKGRDTIVAGITLMNSHPMMISRESLNLVKEVRAYSWDRDKGGALISKPAGGFDHCFVGSTMITTSEGEVPISEVKEGNIVLTSEGYKPVLKSWNNGVKQVFNYSMQFDTFSLSLVCTSDHRIKTTNGWKKVSEVTQGDTLYLHRSLMENCITYTKESGITVGDQGDYTELFGSSIMGRFLRGITSIMLMVIPRTMLLRISTWLTGVYISGMKGGVGLGRTLNLRRNFIGRELRRLRSGISRMMGLLGIGNTQSAVVSGTGIMELDHVDVVELSLPRRPLRQSSALISANQSGGEIQELIMSGESVGNVGESMFVTSTVNHVHVVDGGSQEVFDLTVADCHEYYANGVLVHNCLDATRYVYLSKVSKNRGFVVSSGKVISS